MHILTKLFIVLVSLLAVMLVPLVVVYAHNENSYQARYQTAEARAASARSQYEAAKLSHSIVVQRKEKQIQELETEGIDARKQADRQEAEVRQLNARLVEAESLDAQIQGYIATLTSSVDASQQLTATLIDELRGLRREALASERQKVQLDDALRDKEAQLDVADEARRALQEELQRIKDEHAGALGQIQEYVAMYGHLQNRDFAAGDRRVLIDRDIDCKVLSVRRNNDQVLAEIDAGSRDGVKRGWVMTIGSGGNFVARLRIIEVDINRATGIVELEDEFDRGRVHIGHHAYVRVGN